MSTEITRRRNTINEAVRQLQHQDRLLQLCSKLRIHEPPYTTPTLTNPVCQVLDTTLYAVKVSLPQGSPRRVFIEDLAASLNRRKLLRNEDVDSFTLIGFEIMREI